MNAQLQYGTTAKIFHWLIVALLIVQYLIGWLMPDIHGGAPGTPMILHISFGMVILLLIVLRLVWRLTHPVAPDSSLPAWQRLASEGLHWSLYVAVLGTTMTGWLFASFRGWSVSLFYFLPLPMLAGASRSGAQAIDGWHQIAEWSLLAAIGCHVASAFVHLLVYHDRIMHRMLPGK